MTSDERRADRTRLHEVPTRIDSHTRTTGLFVLVVAVMGGGYVVIRVGVTSAPPLFLAALRFYLTAGTLLSVAVITGRPWLPDTRSDWVAVTVLGTLVFAGAVDFLFVGQQDATASTAAVGMCLGPVLTALVARTLLPAERLSRRQAVGVALGLLGAVLVATSMSAGTGPGIGSGAGLVLCAVASGSFGYVLLGRLHVTASPTVHVSWGALIGGLVLHAASLRVGESVGSVEWTPVLVGVLVYLSVVVGGVGYIASLVLLRTVGPTRASFTSYASPLVATLLGWTFLHEVPPIGVVVGFVPISIGFVLLNGDSPPAHSDTVGESGEQTVVLDRPLPVDRSVAASDRSDEPRDTVV